MPNIKKALSPPVAPVPPPALVSIEDTLDEVGRRALAAARDAEELEKNKREAGLKSGQK